MIHRCNTTCVPARPWWLLAFAALLGASVRAQGPTVTLTPSNFNGYNISCFGMQDGAIDAEVSGGTPPYTYAWTNGATNEDISSLASGYYKLLVTDANSQTGEADITLTEPKPLTLEMEPFKYPSGLNISCFECYNGSIDVTMYNGVPPYAYNWGDGETTEDRSGLGAMPYSLVVTDANGCGAKAGVFLKQPDRDDWTMSGNANTDPSTQYIGTSDEQDVVFKSNGQEVMRLKSDGSISLTGDANASAGVLYRKPDGTLKLGGWPPVPLDPADPCNDLSGFPFWETRGNTFIAPLCDEPLLGTMSEHALRVVTNGEERMVITTTGKVGIGTQPPTIPSAYRLFVEDGIATRDVLVKLGTWPDYVFDDDYRLIPLGELRTYLRTNKHLPTMPGAVTLEEQGGAELGDIQRRLVRTVEEQALYILQLEERLARVELLLQTPQTRK